MKDFNRTSTHSETPFLDEPCADFIDARWEGKMSLLSIRENVSAKTTTHAMFLENADV